MGKIDRDRHLTTEELSAYLDRQLSPMEQEACKAHLESCQQCQRALASLQQTVALLRAMPQPTAPRSFALSPRVTYLQEPTARPAEPTKPAARRRWPYYAQRSLRALSTIAAVIGFIFLLSGVLPLLHSGAEMTSSTSSGSQTEPNTQAAHTASTFNADQKATANAVKSASTPGTPGAPSTPHTSQPGSTPAVAVKTPPAQHSNNTQKQIQAPPLIDLNTPPARQELGLALLIIGIIGILITRRRSAKRT